MTADLIRVTSVLPFDASAIPPDVLAFASTRGRLVHRATELIDEGRLNWDTLDPVLVPYCRAWENFVAETGWHSERTEFEVINERHGYVGHPDRFGRFEKLASGLNFKDTILDIKTPKKVAPTVALQLAAYAEAVPKEWRSGTHDTVRVSVQLKDDGTYRLDYWKEKSDFRAFLAYLTVRKWEIRNGYYKEEERDESDRHAN